MEWSEVGVCTSDWWGQGGVASKEADVSRCSSQFWCSLTGAIMLWSFELTAGEYQLIQVASRRHERLGPQRLAFDLCGSGECIAMSMTLSPQNVRCLGVLQLAPFPWVWQAGVVYGAGRL
ncbi:hypothetical protein CBR_g37137 [Chara braunii]|uniref:Uncharacterized protein n=1 Tax=Chara braunii TaxID=69332 RepID=A0A388LMB0_CHABU|nr:hypothetical protein CBR_g37137 [Chara braunii]|eukprot:GBG83424.1 hypothetical protein CBR_g37137 [Chara braunii]